MALSKEAKATQAKLEDTIKERLANRLQKDMTEYEAKIKDSANMFKNTRVTSCAKVLQKSGMNICMAFNNGASKPVNTSANKLPFTSSFSAETYK